MKWNTVKYLEYKYIGEWYRQKEIGDTISRQQTKLYSKLVSCGTVMELKQGFIPFNCNLITCCECSANASKRLADKFIAQYHNPNQNDFRQVTIGLGYAYECEEAFSLFKELRSDLGKSIYNKRRSSSLKMSPWKEFSIAGSLDLSSCFKVKDFELLGSDIQKKFIDEYGFDPDFRGQDQSNVWDVHIHAVMHVGEIEEDTIRKLLNRYSKSVYIKKLHDTKSLALNIEDYMRYSSKVVLRTDFVDKSYAEWDKSQVQGFGNAVSLERGQQGRQLFVGGTSFSKQEK